MRDLVWETADGRFVPVSRMSSRHIANCVRKIDRSRRRPKWRIEYRDRLVLELEMRSMGLVEDPGDCY